MLQLGNLRRKIMYQIHLANDTTITKHVHYPQLMFPVASDQTPITPLLTCISKYVTNVHVNTLYIE